MTQQSREKQIQAINNESTIVCTSTRKSLWIRESDEPTLPPCINFNEDGWCDMDLFPSCKCPCECYSDKDFFFPGFSPPTSQSSYNEVLETREERAQS